MRLLRTALLRLRSLVGRRALEQDMQDEMREHLEHATERFLARGMSLEEARHAAAREFGNVGVLQEEARDARGGRWVHDLGSDVRFALRHFARRKLTTALIVTVLALGIGTNAAYVSMIQAFFSRPAPAVPDDPAHARIYGLEQPSKTARWELRGFTHPELVALRERTQTFAAVGGWMGHDVVVNPGDSTGPRGLHAQFVTPNFFRVLGVPLAAGPGFVQEESDAPDRAAVLGFALAQELYGTPANAVGKRLLVNDVAVRVAGVVPARFQGALPNDLSERPALWIPVSARAEIAHVSPRWLEEGGPLTLFARLAPSTSHEQATAVARQVVARLRPDSALRVGMSRSAEVQGMRGVPPLSTAQDLVGFAVMGLVGLLILLVACTNVTSLMVAAAVARRQEMAVRLSLGASRGRLMRQLLTESTLLTVIGAAAGILLYWWFALAVVSRMRHFTQYDLSPDFGTLTVTLLVAVGTGILFGLSPALHAVRAGVADALRDSGGGGTHRSRLQRTFVIAQIVFSQPLLVVLAVALSQALQGTTSLPRTVTERVIAAEFHALAETGGPAQRGEAVDSLVRHIAAHPEVVAVVPEPSYFASQRVEVPAPRRSAGVSSSIAFEGTAPGYLAMIGVPIVLGRDVSLADSAGRDVALVIGSDLARALWGEANPVGRRLPSPQQPGRAPDTLTFTVVGVYDAARAVTRPNRFGSVYTAHGRQWYRSGLLVRTRGPAAAWMPELRRLVRAKAPGLPVTQMKTLAQLDEEEQRANRQWAAGMGGAGALALLLASLGLYGVVSLAVRQRTREIGIRIAIGAQPARVARMFLGSGVGVSVAALLVGMPLTLIGLYVLQAQGVLSLENIRLWLIAPSIAAVLLVVATAATWLPARQAARVDPATTLRID